MLTIKNLGAHLNKVTIGDTVVLFSYETAVAFTRPTMNWIVDPTKYSRTTSKHINSVIDKTWRVVAADRESFETALRAAVDSDIDKRSFYEAKQHLEYLAGE